AAKRLANDDVVIAWGDSRHDLFQKSGSTYTPVNEGVFVTLEEVPANTYRLTTPRQIKYFFDKPAPAAQNFMKRMEDPNGNALTFTYSAQGPTKITDASGRSITFAYANGHVTSITDPNLSPARVLQYTYDANGNQITFKDPLNNVTSYQ